MSIKIVGITTTYNIAEKIPYVMPYYERMEIDKLVIYDNYSTDNSVELLSQYPFVEIRYFDTGGLFNDDIHIEIKNSAWKEYKDEYDWCLVTDFDEVIYSRRNIKEVLEEKTKEGKTYFDKIALNLVSRKFPSINGKLIHENVDCGVLWDCDGFFMTMNDGTIMRNGVYGNKIILFDIKNCDIEYTTIGAHDCKIPIEQNKPFDDDISFFHIKYIDANYLVRNSKDYNSRIECSERYQVFIDDNEGVYQKLENNSIDIDYYIDTRGDLLYPNQLILINRIYSTDEGEKIVDLVKRYYNNKLLYYVGLIFYYSEQDRNNIDTSYLIDCGERNGVVISSYCYNNNNINLNHELEYYDFYYIHSKVIKNAWTVFNNNSIIPKLNDINLINTIDNNKLNDYFEYDNVKFRRFSKLVSEPKSTLGCYIIVKNEENNIEKCLSNLYNVCDEIIVVDTGSTDKTVSIAEEFEKVKVYHFEWINDFSAARNYAMSLTKSDYIFTIDADETLTDGLIDIINDLKYENFKDLHSIGLYIKIEEGNFYYGGRQIVRNEGHIEWKYKVHEKLYYNDLDSEYKIDSSRGYINHNQSDSESNYNKYAEVYYNEINDGSVISESNIKTQHYYYYLFFTLKDIDILMAKKYLYNCFDEKRNINEIFNYPFCLFNSNYITNDDFIVNTLINGYKTPNMVMDYIDKDDIDDITKYCALSWLYENGYELSCNHLIDLAYKLYQNGLFNDFIKITKEALIKYPYSETLNYNNNFINDVLSKLNEAVLVIDCKNGINCLPSIINYMSQYFKEIHLINVNECLDYVSFAPFEKVIVNEYEFNDEKYVMKFDANIQYNRYNIKEDIEKFLYR